MIWRILICLVAVVGLSSPLAAFEISAREAILVDETTGTILYQKNANAPTEPSSMTKLMTVYLLFEKLASGTLTLEDTLPVSEKAWRKGGSKMFVEVGDSVMVEDLLRGIVVQSGNDASIVVAEGLSGSEGEFGELMTERARELGMNGTTFRNSSGWPEEGHVTTVTDLALLASRTIRDFPQYYHYYAETEFTYNSIHQTNRNPLLYSGVGADGLKTGYTRAAGYGLTASATRGDRRLILAVNGFESATARARESQAIIEWGFREYDAYHLLGTGDEVGTARVWLGESDTVPLVLADDLVVTLPRATRDSLAVRIVYEGPVPAPIEEGQEIARLVIEAPGVSTVEQPLLAGRDVGKPSLLLRMATVLGYLIFGDAGAL
ncbi:MAG: D-alanyl-D-alanine carboxypeptidase [bacterium]|nr:D-alanyl-D-alanine carboxypeptidase [bacterium]